MVRITWYLLPGRIQRNKHTHHTRYQNIDELYQLPIYYQACIYILPTVILFFVTYFGSVLSVDDVNELRLQARAADQEAVDVSLRPQSRGRASVHAAAVDDADLNHA